MVMVATKIEIKTSHIQKLWFNQQWWGFYGDVIGTDCDKMDCRPQVLAIKQYRGNDGWMLKPDAIGFSPLISEIQTFTLKASQSYALKMEDVQWKGFGRW